MSRIPCLLLTVFLELACDYSVAACAEQDDSTVFPRDITSRVTASKPSRAWTVADVVEITRIKGIAIQGSTKETAFILQRPSIQQGKNLYALYTINPESGEPAKKRFEADYMADLSSRIGSSRWTVRADIGNGVQLYEVSSDGVRHVVVENASTAIIGGQSGLQISATEEPRNTGIISYEWSPDGKSLWYSRIRLRPTKDQAPIFVRGYFFDDTTSTGPMARDIDRALRFLGTELRVLDTATGLDRLVAYAPNNGSDDFDVFRQSEGSTRWVDSGHIQYRLGVIENGILKYRLRRVDVLTGSVAEFSTASDYDIYYSLPSIEGFLTVRSIGTKPHLVNVGLHSQVVKDYGAVSFSRIGGGRRMWRSPTGSTIVFSVEREEGDGLEAYASHNIWNGLTSSRGFLSQCAFNSTLTFGVCSRESLTVAPELVWIAPGMTNFHVLSRPNARYDELHVLKSTPARWTNSYGLQSSGYITLPWNYVSGNKYPTLVVTHGWDAKDAFARDSFQWEFPIQVFAEQGYIVLSVNESRTETPIPPYAVDASNVGIGKEQFYQGYCPLATMEAAARTLIDSGDSDPSKIGIAGYSRGSTVTRFAMSHSTLFAAGSSAESSWWDASGFAAGTELSRVAYTNLMGGSPFDANAYRNYLEFSPSARAGSFSGPLLQQFTDASAAGAVEMDQMLKHAGVPTALMVFPNEAHIFWHPGHRASAMEQNLDWFDYWLRNIRRASAEADSEYVRWDAMALRWKGKHMVGHTP
jgi:dipeptidyl aminopeptidase/acylaminoacyl peptidase